MALPWKVAIVLLSFALHIQGVRLGAEVENGQYSRLVLLSTNDVYKMIGRGNSGKGYFLEVSKGDKGLNHLITECKKEPGGCFPAAATAHLGMQDMPFQDMQFEGTQLFQPNNTCDKRQAIAKGTKFGNVLDWGRTAQLRRLHHKKKQDEDGKTLFLHVLPGDFIGPSYLASQVKGLHMIAMMNRMEVDLVAFGNHDFDIKDALDDRMQQSNFLWLGNNVNRPDARSSPAIADSVQVEENGFEQSLPRNKRVFPQPGQYQKDYWIVNAAANGALKKVCFFGSTDAAAATSAANKAYEFTDALEKNLQTLIALSEEACDFVVALTHQRTGHDILLWDAAVHDPRKPAVPDIILGAHDHYAAFLHLRTAEKITYLWKMGADAHLLGEVELNLESAAESKPLLQLIPVIEHACSQFEPEDPSETEAWRRWNDLFQKEYEFFAGSVLEKQQTRLPISYEGLYDTANVRLRESRAANLLLDIMRVEDGSDFAVLTGGAIRQDAFTVYSGGETLTELDLYEEQPFSDSIGKIEVSLMQLLAFAEYGSELLRKKAISTTIFHVSGFSVVYDDDGAVEVKYDGACHVAGATDRRASPDEGPRRCGRTLWKKDDLPADFNPLEKFTLASVSYALFGTSSRNPLRASGDVALAETTCAIAEEKQLPDVKVQSKYLSTRNGPVAEFPCVDGMVHQSYYETLNSNGFKWDKCEVGGEAANGNCWLLLASKTRAANGAQRARKVLTWMTDSELKRAKVTNAHPLWSVPHAQGNTAPRLVTAAQNLENGWAVSKHKETKAEMLKRGVKENELPVVAEDTLPVPRWLDLSNAKTQENMATLMDVLQTGAIENTDFASLAKLAGTLEKTVAVAEETPTHVSENIEQQVGALRQLVPELQRRLAEMSEKVDEPRRADSLLESSLQMLSSEFRQRSGVLCRLALWHARGYGADEDGRVWHNDVHSYCPEAS
eukprot:TRINITY_DN100600_c0_g1_i1.p1 TRINITY_DN100600_c0_g1~~TRINITY_DN100600_c0_g1_i1.p1  ORF type:complete len:953 (+),score=132.20 TRINITY_DN100600_c0_g1_i1:138-2996(+)